MTEVQIAFLIPCLFVLIVSSILLRMEVLWESPSPAVYGTQRTFGAIIFY